MLSQIEGIAGQQHLFGSHGYENAREQYATSTYGNGQAMSPGLIVEAQNIDDIVRTVQYAKANEVAVAIRTGGHGWGGFSSTSRGNIQLDLAKTFRGAGDQTISNSADGNTLMRTSVSWTVSEFNDFLKQEQLFVPHGQCGFVGLGGHVQTGGFGQLIRSFGLFGDHVVSFEIVDHSGQIRTITKESDPELFFAFLGGSPGNLGVLTHFTVKVHRDSDYEASHGLKLVYPYTSQTLKQLLDILVEMSDDADFPRNYDLTFNVTGSNYPLNNMCHGVEDQLAIKYPESVDGKGTFPRSIVVFAQFVPFQAHETPDMTWFDKLSSVAEPLISSGVQELPMSTLTSWWVSHDAREYELPYQKKLLSTNSNFLTENQWSDWMANRVDKIMAPEDNGLYLCCRFQCTGGDNSRFSINADNGTSYSWRDTTAIAMLSCFHDATPDKKRAAEEWQRTNTTEGLGPDGVFCSEDRSFIWNQRGNLNLDATWSHYYESRDKYERLQKARLAADPHGTFTPNVFSVKRSTTRSNPGPHSFGFVNTRLVDTYPKAVEVKKGVLAVN